MADPLSPDEKDPTANVRQLVDVEKEHAKELRFVDGKLLDAKIETLRAEAKILEISLGLRDQHVNATAALRADFARQLSVAEASRIDAIRAVDVNAVSVASQRASDQATVLANQVAQSAEALRALVATTANTVAQAQQQLGTTLSTRITTLEQAQYEGKGRSTFADPAFAELLTEVKRLGEARNQSVGVSQGISTVWAVFIAAGMLIAAIIVAVVELRPPAPPVQYVPSSTGPAPATTTR